MSGHDLLRRAEEALAELHHRRAVLGVHQHLLGDAAWTILLELFAARLRDAPASVTAIAAAHAILPTSAMRWLAALEQGGLVRDRHGRAELTDDAVAMMGQWASG